MVFNLQTPDSYTALQRTNAWFPGVSQQRLIIDKIPVYPQELHRSFGNFEQPATIGALRASKRQIPGLLSARGRSRVMYT
jgi:hypothetical protein